MTELEVLIQKLQERQNELLDSLGDGSAKDFAQYQYTVGKIQGLLTAQSIAKDLAKSTEYDDD
jgi:hypothetical protein|tara:strand:- start:1501 stop:1689 length:189 start_codon:yes stop_codon:yes gene_type:complete